MSVLSGLRNVFRLRFSLSLAFARSYGMSAPPPPGTLAIDSELLAESAEESVFLRHACRLRRPTAGASPFAKRPSVLALLAVGGWSLSRGHLGNLIELENLPTPCNRRRRRRTRRTRPSTEEQTLRAVSQYSERSWSQAIVLAPLQVRARCAMQTTVEVSFAASQNCNEEGTPQEARR